MTLQLRNHAPWFVPGLFLVWHALQYGFVTDDAYISFVYSRNFAEHGALVFNLGDPVEGFSNFLWTLLLGVLMLVGIDPEVSSQVLGIGFGIGGLFLATRLLRLLAGDEVSRWWEAVPATLLALSSGYACWSSGGLETQMFTFLVTATLYTYVRADEEPRFMCWFGVVGALAALTRPEGLLILGILGVHRWSFSAARDRRFLPRKYDWIAIATILGVIVPFFAWRWWYYGYPLPNTYYIKAAGETSPAYDRELWKNGWYYVYRWSIHSGALVASPICLIGALWASWRSRRFFFGTAALSVLCGYVLYAASVGGDFMGLYRFVMPLFVIVAVTFALGGARIAAARKVAWSRPLAIVLVVCLIAAHSWYQMGLTKRSLDPKNLASDRGIDTPAFLKVYTRDRATIGKHMRDCFDDDDFSIVGGAGAQPYYARMRGIDVFGLVSEDIAHKVKPSRPRAGHNKWAPDSLLAELEPDFVFSCYSIHSRPNNARLNCNPSFWLRRGFERVTLHVPGLVQSGEYYTFLKRRDESFDCPGLVGGGH